MYQVFCLVKKNEELDLKTERENMDLMVIIYPIFIKVEIINGIGYSLEKNLINV